ncbi:hypothetical protein NQS96_08720 [Pseudoalteromonas shioyasakiensis]|uniref:hypothetical protein n=1 Tax=Pseudoalteromonas shioyasakiensis TaxID=1190813 RepID=UPI00211937A7|nr:hypothetical protein [Pseudoalteromonas shioyasakiensis]MCQ8881871.1 hypothetical protein [Pseudoalteromonas shioyasakiensis]
MDQFYVFANQYYIEFYSLKGRVKRVLPISLLILSHAALGLYLTYYFSNGIETFDKFKSVSGILISAVYLSSFVVLIFWFVMKVKAAVIKDFGEKYGNQSTSNLNQLKIIWLKNYFPVDSKDYIKYVDDVKPYLNKMSGHHWLWTYKTFDFFQMIYNETAKSRILALTLALCSLCTILSLHPNASVNFFKLIYDINQHGWVKFAFMLLIVALFFAEVWIAIRLVAEVLIFTLLRSSYVANKYNEKESYFAIYLIDDLVKYHKLPVKRFAYRAG